MPATVGDSMCWYLDTEVAPLLLLGLYLLGDAAFNGHFDIIAPYRTEVSVCLYMCSCVRSCHLTFFSVSMSLFLYISYHRKMCIITFLWCHIPGYQPHKASQSCGGGGNERFQHCTTQYPQLIFSLHNLIGPSHTQCVVAI